jgi:hypothetical protein
VPKALVALRPQQRTSRVIADELIERAVREAGVFPHSVTDRHYGDRTELTESELIVRSLDEMGLLSLSENDPQFAEKISMHPCRRRKAAVRAARR